MNASQVLHGVPVFPLPEYYLFPGTVSPLHIFETRYRQMMRDLMDSSGRFVMAPGEPPVGDLPLGSPGPALPGTGTLVELVQTEELEDGRWLILLLALSRVSLVEVPSDRLYRKADARLLEDDEVDDAAASAVRPRLAVALHDRTQGKLSDLPGDTPVGRLADLLLHALDLDPARRRLAFAERDPLARARLALGWHARRGEEPVDGDAGGDGQSGAR